MNNKHIYEIQNVIDYQFTDKQLLEEALSHPSLDKPRDEEIISYERLEFLGDSVLGLIISEQLLKKYPDEKEGSLAKRKAGLVQGSVLALAAKQLNIGDFIIMSDGEFTTGGRVNESNLENVMEALIGAIYLDGDINEAEKFIVTNWESFFNEMVEPPKDAKTFLQEWSQGQGLDIPEYEVISSKGPSHDPIFEVEVNVQKHGSAVAYGSSKKKAQKEAAKLMIKQLEEDGII